MAKMLVGQRDLDGREQALPGMRSRELQDALQQANGALAPRGKGRVGPGAERGPDAVTLAE